MTSGYIHRNDLTSSHPPFIASSRGLVQRTWQVNKPAGATPDDNGYIFVKAGSLFKDTDDNPIGIVYEDVDVTYGEKQGSIVEAGRVWADRLDSTVFTTEVKTALTAKGLYFDTYPDVGRP